jgi:hypothetical protein
VGRDAAVPGAFETGFAGLADRVTTAFVFVVRGHIAQALVQPDPVVLSPDDGELSAQHSRFPDLQQMRILGLDVPEERLDPRAPFSLDQR